ncbi:MAG: hypothetical protein RMJ43_13485 [Chloroherpetonaceae bacterium]|nr:hypothetical protein [Chthonomonadaceae bacterium]MDW8208841.1 hypothetical protein [Chloroherpetonaceae bacterium]
MTRATASPHALRCASIDVGTNTVKLLVVQQVADRLEPLYERAGTVRLGEGMQASGMRLREAAMRRTLDLLDEFVAQARAQGADPIVAVGTAALREAVNREDFLQRARERCGLEITVISGEEEARLSYLAVRRDTLWRDCPRLVVIDIGGGSTEVIHGEIGTDRIASRVSVGLGAVKLTESVLRSDPPTVRELTAAQQQASGALQSLEAATGPACVVGVGGTVTTLGAMDLGGVATPEVLHGHTLSLARLENLIALLASRTIEQRKQIPGLDPARADIILAGAILLAQALAHLHAPTIDVSTRGLRWGVLYDRCLSSSTRTV